MKKLDNNVIKQISEIDKRILKLEKEKELLELLDPLFKTLQCDHIYVMDPLSNPFISLYIHNFEMLQKALEILPPKLNIKYHGSSKKDKNKAFDFVLEFYRSQYKLRYVTEIFGFKLGVWFDLKFDVDDLLSKLTTTTNTVRQIHRECNMSYEVYTKYYELNHLVFGGSDGYVYIYYIVKPDNYQLLDLFNIKYNKEELNVLFYKESENS